MKRIFLLAVICVFFSTPVLASKITVQSGSVVSFSADTTKAGSLADPWLITETLQSLSATLKFFDDAGGSPLGVNTTGTGHSSGKWFTKTVTNDTSAAWTSFELELQVILGTPSGDGDGLSFAQGGGLTFSSDKFDTYTRIDNTRDYLNFHGGTIGTVIR